MLHMLMQTVDLVQPLCPSWTNHQTPSLARQEEPAPFSPSEGANREISFKGNPEVLGTEHSLKDCS